MIVNVELKDKKGIVKKSDNLVDALKEFDDCFSPFES